MIEIHSIYGLCRPPDMALADIEHCSIPETDVPDGPDDDAPT